MESQPRRLSDGSLPRDDSFVESQQCSADPSAFLGFHVPPSAEEPPLRAPRSTLKLVLDLEAGTDGVRPLQSPANPFSDLFAGDTQDDENVEAQAAEAEELQPVKRRRRSEEGKRSPSPPPTMLKDMENAWREKKQKDAIAEKEERELRDSIPGTSALSECSEDLAPRVFEKVFTPMAEEAKDNGKENEVAADKDPSKSMEDSDRETDFEDELECTQPLDDNDDVDMDGDVTRSYAFSASDEHEEETEVYPYSDTGTQPYGPDSTFMEDDDNDSTSNVRKETEDSYSSSKPSRPTPETVRHSGQRSTEDDFTSREASQSTQQDYLTPRVNPIRVDQPGSNETPTKFVVVNAPNDKTELNSKKSQDEDEQEECVPTQPSKSGIEEEPVAEPSSLQSISKENSAIGASKQNTVADSQTKAIRTLEFSFSMPESQEGEPHFSASLSGDAAKPSESFYRSEKPSPFETSISPVWPPTPTPTPTPVDNPAVPEVTVSTAQKQVSSKRKPVSPSQSDSPTEHKKQRTSPESTESPSHITATPNTKSRKRGFFSPQQSVSSRASEGCDQLTPRPPVRRGTRSAQSTPSSTPTVRTRTKILTPVPVHRAYASRSRTLFKYKFEFCLTGFVKSGEESLKELIEGHGGKIPERYQDVLYKNNPKAVVIATPVSWRKRKFMQAIACGIPVVHTDWIKDCIEAGYVIPFDGYQVPAGYSVTTRKFECFTPRELNIFEGYSFGIVSDVAQTSKAEAKDKANLIAFILKACGADAVYENLSTKSDVNVDIVLSDEYTQTCRYYKKKRRVAVKDFQWVTECMILQQLLDPEEPIFEPQRVGSEDVFSASAEIGDSDNTTLKLYTGELVMADISGSAADHYLLFNVCEILSIHVNGRKDEGSQSRRKDKESRVVLRVGMLKREPYNPELSKSPVKVLDISSSQVKRRVVAIAKQDYGKLKYKDESIFYLEDESEPDKPTASEHKWLTQ